MACLFDILPPEKSYLEFDSRIPLMGQKEETIERLSNICFHDIPVKKVSIHAEKHPALIIEFWLYNEAAAGHDHLAVKFIDILELSTDRLFLNIQSHLEITDFDCQWNDSFEGENIFLLGFGQPSFSAKFSSREGELQLSSYER